MGHNILIINTHNRYKNIQSNNSPLEGESNGLMPFGGGSKKLATNSILNSSKNIIDPSPHRQQVGSATLPQGEGSNREAKILLTTSFAGSAISQGEGNNLSEVLQNNRANSATLPFKYYLEESYNIELKNKNVIRFYSKQTLEFAKNLRNSQTDAEILLWYYLKNKQLGGYKFRRQQPIDQYIIDFVCFEKKLIVELDGSQHAEEYNIQQDLMRGNFLKNLGFKILRFWNNEIFTNCFDVLDFIFNEIESISKNNTRFIEQIK